LNDLDAESLEDARSLRDAKRVLRPAIDACLDGRVLKSRAVMRALRQANRRFETLSPRASRPPPELPVQQEPTMQQEDL
jgi:hypothetical protein